MCKRLFTTKLNKLLRNVLLTYLLTFGVALPLICSNLQNTELDQLYSRNTSSENARLMKINAQRHNRSLEILKASRERSNLTRLHTILSDRIARVNAQESLVLNQHIISKTHRKVDLVVTVITVSRTSKTIQTNRTNYLAQTLAAFIDILDTQDNVFDRFSVRLRVCNVDPEPGHYHDMRLVPDWIPIYQRFSTPHTPLERMTYNARLNKEKDDYVYCLDKSLQENASFILLVEDDAVPRKELFSVVETKIFRIFDENKEIYPIIHNVTFIKLYHPERLLGYISIELDRIMELLSLGVILTTIAMYTYIIWTRNGKKIPIFLWVVTFLFFVCVILIIGRSNILELRRVSDHAYQIAPAPSCCTPAMLFPRQGAQLVSDYLKTVECKAKFGKDSALDKLKKTKHLVTKLIVPNLFEHIGHFSSLRNELLNPFIV